MYAQIKAISYYLPELILSNEDLTKLLEDAVKDEDFDVALEIQEEIKRRKKKID